MYQKFIQKVNSLWEKFVRNRSVYKKLCGEHERTTDAFNKLREKYDKLRLEQDTLSQKYKLVSDLLAATPNKNEKFEEFKELVEKDFMNFANKESSLAEEAAAVQKMQTIEKRLEEVVAFPHTITKKSIAIGGAYSSGKSEFVNSFITGSNVKIHVDVDRATAIPSVVISSSKVSIKGFSRYGASVDIEPEFYSQLSHNFIETFSFNLKDLMPSITVEVPLVKGLFENICLIDTPGYDSGGKSEDRNTAADILKDIDALIWMISVTEGTISQSDLNFIEDMELDMPFYVVLNKADRKHKNKWEKILAQIRKTLEAHNIKYKGISLYSARNERKKLDSEDIKNKGISALDLTRFDEEYLFDRMSLHDFFRSQNQPKRNIEDELKEEIKEVFGMYEEAICKDEKTAKMLMKEIQKLSFYISEELKKSKLDPDEMDDLTEKIDNIRKSQNKDFTSIKEQMSQIKKKMLKIVDEIFWSLRPQSTEVESQPQSTYTSRCGKKEGSDGSTRPWYFTQAIKSTGESRGSTSRRQGYIRDGKYIKTDAEHSDKPSLDSKRVYEVAHEFYLSNTEMIALLRNLGFQVKDHMSVYTTVMAEAVQLDAERRAAKKNTEASQARQLININQATAKELKRLLGISSKIAKRIVAYRKQNGPFQCIEDLVKVQGISLKMVNQWFGRYNAKLFWLT